MSGIRRALFSINLTLVLAVASLGCGGGAPDSASDLSAGEAPSSTETRAVESGDAAMAMAAEDAPEILVYKSPTCGCCAGWVEHLRERGYEVTVEDRSDLDEIKNLLGIPLRLRSCHTAEVGRYLVEGHVPAEDIGRLLREEPRVAGIAVPGMPIGSPGMEVPGRTPDRYDVLAFDADGRTTVYASH